MSLMKCQTCGHDVSTQAQACPACGAPVKKPFGWPRWLLVLGLVLACLILALVALRQEAKIVEVVPQHFPGPWEHTFHPELNRALMVHDVRGCGDYWYQQSVRDPGKYLVHCTRDGRTWTAYLVWPRTEDVAGPFTPHPLLR
jgi:hypothetical protein